MNLRQLEYFVSVAETLSFTKTAEKFFISQTAITQQIKALEKQLDVTLLKRTKRHVELTPAGSVFLSEAKAILTRTENAIARTKKTATGFSGVLNLGIMEGYEEPMLPDIIRRFRTRYPNISLSITESNVGVLYERLINQELDAVLNLNNPHAHLDQHNITYTTVKHYNLVAHLPASHPLAFKNVLDLSELKNDSFIFTGTHQEQDNFGHYRSTMEHFVRMGFTPNVVYTSQNFRTTALMVAANLGVAVLPSYALSGNPLMHGNHVSIPLNQNSDLLEIVAARYVPNHNPTIDKFLSYF